MVIAQSSTGELGLVVEELLGQQQVVIKPLGERFKALRGVAGAAILGDGRVGLILEMSGIAALHNACRASHSIYDCTVDGTSPQAALNRHDDDAIDDGVADNIKDFAPV